MQKYQSTSDAAKKEGNSSKARRMGRIVKQYQDAIKSHKAGRKVNFNELPVPPGFPPIPGVNEVQQPDVFQQANALMQQNVDDDEENPPSLKPPTTVVRKASPQRSGDPGASQRVSPSPQPSNSATNRPPTKFDQQVSFLENRQAAFKTA
uniref:DM14 domain-containing protein n=1 Tax=Ciona savignyi TaxID=51511 RepID=H2Z493_CIOSA